jgi:hypothetical protein
MSRETVNQVVTQDPLHELGHVEDIGQCVQQPQASKQDRAAALAGRHACLNPRPQLRTEVARTNRKEGAVRRESNNSA